MLSQEHHGVASETVNMAETQLERVFIPESLRGGAHQGQPFRSHQALAGMRNRELKEAPRFGGLFVTAVEPSLY